MTNTKNILVYLDGTDNSYTAAQYAVYLAKAYNMGLYGVTIVKNNTLDELVHSNILLPTEKEEYLDDLNRDTQKFGHQFRKLAQEKEITPKIFVISGGGSRKAIIDLITEHQISCLVVGELPCMRSRTSTSYDEIEQLIHNVPCCVLIAKNAVKINKLFEAL